MTIERLNPSRPTLLEIDEAWANNLYTDTEYESKMYSTADDDAYEVSHEIGAPFSEGIYAIAEDGDLFHGDWNEIIDMIVEKNVTYTARVNGRPALVRSDDNKVFYLFSTAEVIKAMLNSINKEEEK